MARPMVAETVSLGAAYAAGLAAGLRPDPEVLRRCWYRAGEGRPARSREWHEEGCADWKRAVERSLGWVREGRPR